MNQLLQALINGVMLGGFYAIMVLGFSIIWGVMGVINLAHGEIVMLGAYGAWILQENLGMDPIFSVVVILPVMMVFGYLVQRILINRVIERPHMIALLVTFGFSIVISNVVKLSYSGTPRSVESSLRGYWDLGGVTVPKTKTGILIAALIVMLVLHLFLKHSRLGKSIRAASQNREAARIVGIEIGRVYAITFAIAIGITALAGAMISPTQAVYPFMGAPLTLRAFTITALSGLGSIPGALFGGLAVGVIEVMLATFVPRVGTNVGIVSSFVLLVIVLVLRPQGLFGGLKPRSPQ